MTKLPNGFMRLPILADVVAVDSIECVLVVKEPPQVVIELKNSGRKFAIEALSEAGAALIRDEVVHDMWRAANPMMAALDDLHQRTVDGDPLSELAPTGPRLNGVWIRSGTPQWRAWEAFRGRTLPQDNEGGWIVEREWPPGHRQS